MKFIQQNFDKLLLFVVFVMIFTGYIVFRFDALERMLDAIIIAIFTIIGVRRVGDAVSTNIENIEKVNTPMDTPVFHEKGENE